MERFIYALLFIVFITGCNQVKEYASPDQMVEEAGKAVKNITVEDLKKLMDSEEIYTLIDVRQKSEHYYGYIPGSLVIPRGSLEFLIGNQEYWDNEGLYMPEKDEKIILYDKKGKRSILAAYALKQLGYKNVYVLEGGWKKWELTYPDDIEKDLDMLSGGNHEEEEAVGGC